MVTGPDVAPGRMVRGGTDARGPDPTMSEGRLMQTIPSEADILSARPEELTLMLYEGAVRFAREAADARASGDPDEARRMVARVDAILVELAGSLNPEAGELSANLGRIYEYLSRRLAVADRAPGALEEVADHLQGLADAWREIARPAVAGGVR
jgi:flagellar protein FliS